MSFSKPSVEITPEDEFNHRAQNDYKFGASATATQILNIVRDHGAAIDNDTLLELSAVLAKTLCNLGYCGTQKELQTKLDAAVAAANTDEDDFEVLFVGASIMAHEVCGKIYTGGVDELNDLVNNILKASDPEGESQPDR